VFVGLYYKGRRHNLEPFVVAVDGENRTGVPKLVPVDVVIKAMGGKVQ
jgi:hypothetical protein